MPLLGGGWGVCPLPFRSVCGVACSALRGLCMACCSLCWEPCFPFQTPTCAWRSSRGPQNSTALYPYTHAWSCSKSTQKTFVAIEDHRHKTPHFLRVEVQTKFHMYVTTHFISLSRWLSICNSCQVTRALKRKSSHHFKPLCLRDVVAFLLLSWYCSLWYQ